MQNIECRMLQESNKILRLQLEKARAELLRRENEEAAVLPENTSLVDYVERLQVRGCDKKSCMGWTWAGKLLDELSTLERRCESLGIMRNNQAQTIRETTAELEERTKERDELVKLMQA